MVFKKLFDLFRQQLTQGASPRGLALSCAMGVSLGLFPVIGTTTALCFIVGTWMRLNQPIMQFWNYVLYPLHLLMIPVFIYFGETLAGAGHSAFAIEAMLAEFRADPMLFLKHSGAILLYAVIAWSVTIPFVAAAVFFPTRAILVKRFQNLPKGTL